MLRRLKSGETRELTKTQLLDSISWFTSHMSQVNKDKTLVFVKEALGEEVDKIVVSRKVSFDEPSNTHSDNYYFRALDSKSNRLAWLRFNNISELPRRNPIFGFVVTNHIVEEGAKENGRRKAAVII